MRKERGFTLVELLVTIAVLAVIAVMAVPAMGNLVEKQKFNSNERDLINAISQSRSQAVLNRSNTVLALNSSASTLTSINWQPMAYVSLTANQIAVDPTTGNSSVGSAVTLNTLTFSSTGQISSLTTDIQISLCDSNLKIKKIMVITKLGNVFSKPQGTC